MIKLFLLIPLVLSACGSLNEKFGRQHGGETSVRFQLADGPEATTLAGIMVYAVRVGNENSRGGKFISDQNNASVGWIIPNGNYHFFAFGYDGANMTGNMYCGKSLNQGLGGGTLTIALHLQSTGICGLPPFSPVSYGAASTDYPKGLYVGHCASTGGDMSILTSAQVCNSSGGTPASSSGLNSIKIYYPEFARWDPSAAPQVFNSPMNTACLPGAYVGSGPVTTSRNLPFGGAFVASLEAFSDSACATKIGSYSMVAGMVNASENSLVVYRNSGNAVVNPALQMMKPTPGASSAFLYLRAF